MARQVWLGGRTSELSWQRNARPRHMSPLLTEVLLIPMAMLPAGPTLPSGPAMAPAPLCPLPAIRAVAPLIARLLPIPAMATGTIIRQARFSSDRLTSGLPSGLQLPLAPLSQVPRLLGRGLLGMALLAVGTRALMAPVKVQSILLPLRTPNLLAWLSLALLRTLMRPVLRARHLRLQLLATFSCYIPQVALASPEVLTPMWQHIPLFSSVAPLLTPTAGLPRALRPEGPTIGGLPLIPPDGAMLPPMASVVPPLMAPLAGVLLPIPVLKCSSMCGPELVP